jgi:hypothetical protein
VKTDKETKARCAVLARALCGRVCTFYVGDQNVYVFRDSASFDMTARTWAALEAKLRKALEKRLAEIAEALGE